MERDEHDPRGDLRVRQHASQRCELFAPQLARRHEGRPRHRAGEGHDGHFAPELDDGEASASRVDRELGEIAHQVRREVALEATRGERPARVEIVIARDDRHARGVEAELALEEVAHELVFALEREVREVAGDDDVLDVEASDLAGDGAYVGRAVDAPALQAQVDPAGESLVEKASRGHSLERQQVQIGEMSDPHRVLAAQRKPTHGGRGRRVVSRAAARSHIAPLSKEPPRTT